MTGDDEPVPKPDRRGTQRYAARIKVSFRSIDELVTAYTGDLSHGGLYVAAAQQLPPGSEVQLSLEVPDGGPPARIPARVAYTLSAEEAAAQGRQPGMGMEFLEVHTRQLARRIAAYVSSSVEMDIPAVDTAFLNVLVVEDSASQRSKVTSALRDAGIEVMEAEHGLEGLGKAIKDQPDLVLTDVNMPVMDGWQLLRLLRGRPDTKSVPIVFLTTLGSEQDRIRGYEAGVDDYIAKPFIDEELVARVRRVVARARAEHGLRDHDEHGMTGDLRQVSIASLLAFAEAERRSGLVTLHGPRGGARVGLYQGVVISVDLPEGNDAPLFERLIEILDWDVGRFDLSEGDLVDQGEAVIVQQALLEHARRKDEAGA
jgi:two-component system chemotaxis response regulator CheY